ncbi:hypothetical protein BP6252_03205 [Coleophoma cylindrospora]|uniref:DUF2293 domain-containing protein n=1 Tax=Coleophoma cylindrospora TaxID=1849047 RepID=A0A3D8S731_9HELO|nr:hypothetical protein BP6252_03205 [Coleophoma cylindrospora]
MVGSKKKEKARNLALSAADGKKKVTVRRRPDVRSAKEKHKHFQRRGYDKKTWAQLPPVPSGLVARLEAPKIKSKHQSYFEFAENTEKKKKLETTVTTAKEPPPGFEFIPIGDPTLSNACKELSREQGALVFIVSSKSEDGSGVYDHVDRIGYHFRESIVEEARELVGQNVSRRNNWNVEAIPESQEEINKQTDAAIRDIFPRIPNTDRQQIIEHGFQKGKKFQGREMIGLQPGIPLARRVQLAVLAHIRHTHTRYDMLLRETSWENARRAVEPVCLDFILKWRGDEETGRDQMDEILREVVVITDSENDNSEGEEDDGSTDEEGEVSDGRSQERLSRPESTDSALAVPSTVLADIPQDQRGFAQVTGRRLRHRATRDRPAAAEKKAQRGFARYQAAYEGAMSRRQEGTGYETIPMEAHPRAAPPHLAYHSNIGHSGMHRQEPHVVERFHEIPNNSRPPYYHSAQASPGVLIRRDDGFNRPPSERPVYHAEPRPLGSPSYQIPEERLPVMVRGTPPRHGLQDMLVRSVETPSSDVMVASPRSNGELVYRSLTQAHDSYQRHGVEGRRVSPPRRQIIVLDDDSPQVKRRRVIEDDHGQFRPMPSREQDHYLNIGYGQEPASRREVFRAREPVPSYHSGAQSQSQRQLDHQPYHGHVNENMRPRTGAIDDHSYLPVQPDYGSGSHMHRPSFFEHEPVMRTHPRPVIAEPFIDRFSQARLEPFPKDDFPVALHTRSQPLSFSPSYDERQQV